MKTSDSHDRLIHRALRDYQDDLPADFAAQTAALVESASRAGNTTGDRLETWLQRTLIGVLILAAVVAVLTTGGSALATFGSLPSVEWISTIALCFALSLGMQHVVQRLMRKT